MNLNALDDTDVPEFEISSAEWNISFYILKCRSQVHDAYVATSKRHIDSSFFLFTFIWKSHKLRPAFRAFPWIAVHSLSTAYLQMYNS